MVNYPIKKKSKKTIVHKNRGMALEEDINSTNEYYLAHGIAVIHKKPVPIKVVDVNYESRHTAEITKAYYVTPSTTDYNGVYKGYYLDFEAKETSNKTSLPIQNIHSHQVEHLKSVIEHGGIAFIIVRFSSVGDTFLLEGKHLIQFAERSKNGRKSISYREFKENGFILEDSYNPRIPYLKVIDEIIKKML